MADIIRLPNAAAVPVVQKRGPGGRPKKIVSLARARLDRTIRERKKAEAQDAPFSYPPDYGHMSIWTLPSGRWEFSASGLYQADPFTASAVLHAAAAQFDRLCGLTSAHRANVTLIANFKRASFPQEANQS